MLPAVKLLLSLVLLGCPYICIGQQAAGVVCADRTCTDDCRMLPHSNNSGCCQHDEQADFPAVDTNRIPADDSPTRPQPPFQCLCQGGVADAVSRPVDFQWALSAVTDADIPVIALASSAVLAGHFRVGGGSEPCLPGREILMRVGSMLI